MRSEVAGRTSSRAIQANLVGMITYAYWFGVFLLVLAVLTLVGVKLESWKAALGLAALTFSQKDYASAFSAAHLSFAAIWIGAAALADPESLSRRHADRLLLATAPLLGMLRILGARGSSYANARAWRRSVPASVANADSKRFRNVSKEN